MLINEINYDKCSVVRIVIQVKRAENMPYEPEECLIALVPGEGCLIAVWWNVISATNIIS